MSIARRVSAAGLAVFLVAAIAAAASPLWGRWRAMPPQPMAPGDTVNAYGPRTFTTPNGASTNFIERLNITPVLGTRYLLKVENGVGGPLVSIGTIRLGGNIIISTPDLNGSGPVYREMVVTGQDTIRATIAGSAGANIRVTVLAMADPYVTIHQKTYIQPTGVPMIVTDPITRPPGVTGPFLMFIQNGNANGTQRIASGTMVLSNGSSGSAAFTSAQGTLVNSVNVGATGTLRVTTASFANTRVTVRITGRDVGAPVLTITTPAPNTITNQAQVDVTGTVQDATATAVTVNGAVATRNGNNYSATVNLAEGSNTLQVSAVDAAGNHTDSTRTITRDSQAPTLTITSPQDGLVTQAAQVTVSGSVSDASTVTVKVNDTPLTVAADGTFSGQIPIVEGTNFLTVTATDQGGNATSGVRRVVRDNSAPSLTVATPADSTFTNQGSVVVSGRAHDANGVSVSVNGVPTPLGLDSTYSTTVELTTEGTVEILVSATDPAGNSVSTTRLVIHDTELPTISVTAPLDGSTTPDATVTVTGTVTDASPVRLTVNGTATELSPSGAFSKSVDLNNGPNTITLVATDSATNTRTVTLTVTRATPPAQGAFTEVLGIDNAVNAPALDQTIVEPLAATADFLYVGANAPQQGVPPGTIKREQAGILRGRVLTREGTPLSGVAVTVLSHPEYGVVQSRANGLYELVVNAGGPITLDFKRAGLIPSQRTFVTERQDFTVVPDVALIALDTVATMIGFTEPLEVARASVASDANGSRQATLMFPQGTIATAIHPNGTQRTLSSITVRATEYTVGPNGERAMPAELPPTTAYTYAIELSADEVDLAAGEEVHFSQPIPFWVENFRGFPVGLPVPMGFYDRRKGRWLAEENGRVVRVLSVSGGIAALDVTGDSTPASQAALDTLGITTTELQQVAQLYAVNQTLWRARVTHFSPYDGNYPSDGGDIDGSGVSRRPKTNPPTQDKSTCESCEMTGSIIETENQVLGQSLGVPGTGLSLNYRSDRVPGRNRYFRLNIPLTDSILPQLLADIEIDVWVAGRSFEQHVTPSTNLTTTFVWDGLDAFGRPVSGPVPYRMAVQYRYPRLYGYPMSDPRTFGRTCVPSVRTSGGGGPAEIWLRCVIPGVSDLEENLDRQQQRFEGTIGAWVGAARQGFGGWTLSAQHVYDPISKTLYMGNGTRQDGRTVLKPDRRELSGTGDHGYTGDGGPALQANHGVASSVAVFPNGDFVFADSAHDVVRRVTKAGIISTVAGTGAPGMDPAGGLGPATALRRPSGVAVAGDGTVYIADSGNERILRVLLDGTTVLVAGNGTPGFSGDGGPAIAASLSKPSRVAVDPAGTLFIADRGNERVRVVNPAGDIATLAGGGTADECAELEGIVAASACIGDVLSMAVMPDGAIILGLEGRIRRVDATGSIRTIAGNGDPSCGFGVFEGPAMEFNICPKGLAVDRQGTVYVFEGNFVRKVTNAGFLLTWRSCNDFGQQQTFRTPVQTLVSSTPGLVFPFEAGEPPAACVAGALGADNALYVSERPGRIVRIALATPGYEATDFMVASGSGDEFYEFDVRVRHIRTRKVDDARVLYTLEYDTLGRVSAVVDRVGLRTVVTRDPSTGRALEVSAPFGQRTALGYDANGWLAQITLPDSAVVTSTYATGGLLASLTDPVGSTTAFAYDTLGRFIHEQGPRGFSQSVAVSDSGGTKTATMTDAAGLVFQRIIESDRGESKQRTTLMPGERDYNHQERSDGEKESSAPDGTGTQAFTVPDPVFGLQIPRLQTASIRFPNVGTARMRSSHNVQLASPGDPRTIQRSVDSLFFQRQLSVTTTDLVSGVITVQNADETTDSVSFDTLGNVTRVAKPGRLPILYGYDSLGRMTSVRQGTTLGRLEYGPDGLVQRKIDPQGFVTQYERDAVGRITRLIRPDGQSLRSAYDRRGRLVSVTPPGRPAYRFTYDSLHQPDSVIAPAVAGGAPAVTRFVHDAASRMTSSTKPDGTTLQYDYDSLGQLSRVHGSGIDHLFTYRSSGKLRSIASPTDTITFTYGGRLVTRVAWTGRLNSTVFLSYNDSHQIEAIEVADAPLFVGYEYDDPGRLTTVGAMSLDYDAATGALAGAQVGTIANSWSYDSLSQLVRARFARGATTLADWTYQHDAGGRIGTVREVIGSDTTDRAFTYDTVGRLATVARNGTVVEAYSYDANGNRTQTVTPAGTRVATFDARDRLLAYGTTAYEYTANDELYRRSVGSAVTQFTYDALGNLVSVALPDGGVVEYGYDPMGRRITRSVDGVVTRAFVYQSKLAPAVMLDGNGNVLQQYVYGTRINVPDYMHRDGVTYRFITDERGSVRTVVNAATGAVVQRLDYDAWGAVTLNTNPGFQPFGYAGGIADDDTKLVQFGARDYDPEAGRWTTKDPIGFAGGASNFYTYAGNDPISLSDPSGLQPVQPDAGGPVEVIMWRAVGSGGSSFGHISTHVDGMTYSYGPGGYVNGTISTKDFLEKNGFREGLKVTLKLTPEQRAKVVAALKDFDGSDYGFFFNNCTDPIEKALEKAGIKVGVNARPVSLIDNLLDRGLVSGAVTINPTRKAEGKNAPWTWSQ